MAKREIPEINAGSMADIAFLLLIFFLVTTTMDRDKAYPRDIPKKILVEINEPVEVEERNILAIRANGQNQLMVRDELMNDPNEISDRILEFYRTNEKSNDLTSPFPLYSRTSKEEIKEKVLQAERALEEVEEASGVEPDIIQFKEAQLKEWEKKERAMKLYGRPELPEIHSKAHIRIEVQSKTGYGLFAKIQSEIEEALFELRNDAANDLFGEGYGTIVTRYNSDRDNDDFEKLSLLKILYPDRIIEVKPKN